MNYGSFFCLFVFLTKLVLISQVVWVFSGNVLNLFYITGLWVQFGQCDHFLLADVCVDAGCQTLMYTNTALCVLRCCVFVFLSFYQNNAKYRSLWMRCFLFSLCMYSTLVSRVGDVQGGRGGWCAPLSSLVNCRVKDWTVFYSNWTLCAPRHMCLH